MTEQLIAKAKPAMSADRADHELLHAIHGKPDGIMMLPMGVLEPDELQQAFMRANMKGWIRFFDVIEITVPPANLPQTQRLFMITLDGIARLNSLMRSH